MRFVYRVEVEVEREEGRFASRDEIGEEIRTAVEEADPGSVEGENGGIYGTVTWEVSEVEEPARSKGKAS